jgi:hypothetical protein
MARADELPRAPPYSKLLRRTRPKRLQGHERGSLELRRPVSRKAHDSPLDCLFDGHPQLVRLGGEDAGRAGESLDDVVPIGKLHPHQVTAGSAAERPRAVGSKVHLDRAHPGVYRVRTRCARWNVGAGGMVGVAPTAPPAASRSGPCMKIGSPRRGGGRRRFPRGRPKWLRSPGRSPPDHHRGGGQEEVFQGRVHRNKPHG